jgi:hypothetical protein
MLPCPGGKLFTALDAGPTLVPAGDQITALPWPERTGRSPARPAPGWTRRSCAGAAIRSFLAQVAWTLVHPEGTAEPAGASPPRRPLGEHKP